MSLKRKNASGSALSATLASRLGLTHQASEVGLARKGSFISTMNRSNSVSGQGSRNVSGNRFVFQHGAKPAGPQGLPQGSAFADQGESQSSSGATWNDHSERPHSELPTSSGAISHKPVPSLTSSLWASMSGNRVKRGRSD